MLRHRSLAPCRQGNERRLQVHGIGTRLEEAVGEQAVDERLQPLAGLGARPREVGHGLRARSRQRDHERAPGAGEISGAVNRRRVRAQPQVQRDRVIEQLR